jgi:hypothetical protein
MVSGSSAGTEVLTRADRRNDMVANGVQSTRSMTQDRVAVHDLERDGPLVLNT